MTGTPTPVHAAGAWLCALGMVTSALAHAQTPEQQYRRDRAACASVPAASRSACLREAGAQLQTARAAKGAASISAATYAQNALARCEVFKTDADRADCRARLGPQASVSGSVEGGGLLREAPQGAAR